MFISCWSFPERSARARAQSCVAVCCFGNRDLPEMQVFGGVVHSFFLHKAYNSKHWHKHRHDNLFHIFISNDNN